MSYKTVFQPMRQGRKSRVLSIATAFVSLVLCLNTAQVAAQSGTEADDPVTHAFLNSNQAGVRLGGWSNQGATPPDSLQVSANSFYQNDIGSGSFYLEGFFGFRLSRALMLEFSLGLVSRGDVYLVEETGGSSIGTLQVYPILAKVKFYPSARPIAGLFPYLLAGGGVYYGRHDIQFVTGIDAAYRAAFGENSKTDFSYVLGGGIDWPVASVVALDLNAQYMPVKFSGNLIGVDDYSSLTITVGVKYLASRKAKKEHPHRLLSRR
ncbi:MAG: outer membrane beta-barrel protein [Candidatus Zixiibacteriota bacterium]